MFSVTQLATFCQQDSAYFSELASTLREKRTSPEGHRMAAKMQVESAVASKEARRLMCIEPDARQNRNRSRAAPGNSITQEFLS